MSNSDYTVKGTGPLCSTAEVATAIGYLDSSIQIKNLDLVDEDSLAVGEAFMIDDEVLAITAVSGNTISVRRGCVDTIPATHAVDTIVWFFENSLGSDYVEYAAGETIGVKVLPKTASSGAMPLEAAPPHALTFNWRFARPYPPGDVKANGVPWFNPVALGDDVPQVALAWVHRDRIVQADTLVGHTEPSIGPETGTTYEAKVYDSSNVLKRTQAVPTGTAWAYDWSQAAVDFDSSAPVTYGYITLASVRDGLTSLNKYRIDFSFPGFAARYTITLGGTFSPGVHIDVFAFVSPTNTQISDYMTVSGDTDLNGAAESLADDIDASGTGYTASSSGNVVTVSGPSGEPYSLIVDIYREGITSFTHETAEAANPGSAFSARVFIGNSLTGITNPIPAGQTFVIGIEHPVGTLVGSASYTTAIEESKTIVINGIVAALNASGLPALGYTFNADTFGGDIDVLIGGPAATGNIQVKVDGTGPAPWTLNTTVVTPGHPVVPADRPQESHVVIGLTPIPGDNYVVTIDGVDYSYLAVTGDTISSATAALATAIDAAPGYTVTVVSDVIHVVGAPADVFNLTAKIRPPMTATVANAGSPSAIFDGTAFIGDYDLVSHARGLIGRANALNAYRSTDGGRTYFINTAPSGIGGIGSMDRAWLAVTNGYYVQPDLNTVANSAGYVLGNLRTPSVSAIQVTNDPVTQDYKVEGYPQTASGETIAIGAFCGLDGSFYIVGRLADQSQTPGAMYLYVADEDMQFIELAQLMRDPADPGYNGSMPGGFTEVFVYNGASFSPAPISKLKKIGGVWFLWLNDVMYRNLNGSPVTGWRKCTHGLANVRDILFANGKHVAFGGISTSPGVNCISESVNLGTSWTASRPSLLNLFDQPRMGTVFDSKFFIYIYDGSSNVDRVITSAITGPLLWFASPITGVPVDESISGTPVTIDVAVATWTGIVASDNAGRLYHSDDGKVFARPIQVDRIINKGLQLAAAVREGDCAGTSIYGTSRLKEVTETNNKILYKQSLVDGTIESQSAPADLLGSAVYAQAISSSRVFLLTKRVDNTFWIYAFDLSSVVAPTGTLPFSTIGAGAANGMVYDGTSLWVGHIDATMRKINATTLASESVVTIGGSFDQIRRMRYLAGKIYVCIASSSVPVIAEFDPVAGALIRNIGFGGLSAGQPIDVYIMGTNIFVRTLSQVRIYPLAGGPMVNAFNIGKVDLFDKSFVEFNGNLMCVGTNELLILSSAGALVARLACQGMENVVATDSPGNVFIDLPNAPIDATGFVNRRLTVEE